MAKLPKNGDLEYGRMKDFLSFFAERHFQLGSLGPEAHPIARLEALEKKSLATARSGLRQAVSDCITMSSHWDSATVDEFDSDLRDGGVVTLTEMRRRFSKGFKAILKRGRIKDETEYHLVRNVLGDAIEKTPEEQEKLSTLISAFERSWTCCTHPDSHLRR